MKISLRIILHAGIVLSVACAGLAPAIWAADRLAVHNLHSGKSFSSIRDAVEDESTLDGHVLSVIPGTYTENVEVTKSLTIRSASGNPSDTVVQAKNIGSPVFRLMMNGVKLSGFSIQGASKASGIEVYTSEKCQVMNNEVTGNYYGIHIKHGARNTFQGNTVVSNKVHGFYVASSRLNTLIRNFANSNGTSVKGNGFYLYFSDQCTLESNTAGWNGECGIALHEANGNILKNNTVDSNKAYGIFMSKSSNSTLTGNTLSRNGNDFEVVGSSLSHFTHTIDKSNTVNGEPLQYEVTLPESETEYDAEPMDPGRPASGGKRSYGKKTGMLLVDENQISRRAGGTVTFTLKAGRANRTKRYLLLGGLSGTYPGTPLPGDQVTLPLKWDSFTTYVIAFMNTTPFSGFMGELDSRGEATAVFDTLGPLPPDMVGLRFVFAYALHDHAWDFVSHPVLIKIKP